MSFKKISAFPYSGGKYYLLEDIYKYFTKSKCKKFVDVFGGSANVVLNVNTIWKVYNDLDGRLVNLFTLLRDDPDALARMFHYAVASRAMFDESCEPSPIPAQDAWRFLYHQNLNFGGKYISQSFGYSNNPEKPAVPRNVADIEKIIKVLHFHAKTWLIEHLDFSELIEKYDSKETFFYLDPPYWDFDFYAHNFRAKDFFRLKKSIDGIEGSYLMNINADKNVVMLFGEPQDYKDYINTASNVSALEGETRTNRREFFYTNVKNVLLNPPKSYGFDNFLTEEVS